MNPNNNLYLVIVDKKRQPLGQGCGYFYLVRKNHFAHTAFRTKAGLKKWMRERGLRIGKRKGFGIDIIGQYFDNCEMINRNEFEVKYNHLPAIEQLDNGDFTKGFVEDSRQGKIIHYQNPNCDRIVYDYSQVREKHF